MRGRLVISLDFEKYWGMWSDTELANYKANLVNVDHVVLRLLKLFSKRNIHATWAVVGLMFHENESQIKNYLPESTRFYTETILNPYDYIERADLEPKFHFAKNLIGEISNTPHQEVASHTYSHFYCLEDGQTEINFRQDLELFRKVSVLNGYNASTIVFPRNQANPDYIPILREFGINAYRGNEKHYMYEAVKTNKNYALKRALRLLDRYINISGHNTYRLNGVMEVYNVRASRFLAPYSERSKFLEPLRIRRIKQSMTYAAKNGEIFHLWWHPHNFGNNVSKNMDILTKLLDHYDYLNQRYGMKSVNVAELISSVRDSDT